MLKRNVKLLVALVTIVLIIFTLCGCDQKIADEKKLVNTIESIVPGAKYKDMTEEKGEEEGELIHTYTFKANGVTFTVLNTLFREDYFGNLTNGYRHDYYIQLLKDNKSEIEDIAESNNIAIVFEEMEKEAFQTLKEEDGVLCRMTAGTGDYSQDVSIGFYIDNYKQIDNVDDFLYDLKKEFQDIIQTKYHKMFKNDLTIGLYLNHDIPGQEYMPNRVNYDSMQLIKGQMDSYDMFGLWSDYLYKNYVYEGKIIDSDVDLRKFQPYKLDKLYIDGELFKPENEKYKTEFFYNIEDEQYYTAVCYGCLFDYNGGVEDYVQREIIEKYYPNCKYEIDSKFNKTTYKIGKDKFVIDRNDFSSTDDLVFTKNGKTLDIKELSQINMTAPGPSYYKFIPVDDFAMLCGMKVDNINVRDGAVYLELK